MQDKDLSRLINDESFLNYCFRRNDRDVRYWEQWLEENPQYRAQVEEVRQIVILLAEESRGRVKDTHFAQLQQKIEQSRYAGQRAPYPLWKKLTAAAAAALLIISMGAYFFLREMQPQDQLVQNDVPPGGNKAVLTLADGRAIDLSSEQSGIIMGDKQITYDDGTQIPPVNSSQAEGRREIAQLSLTTPRGGQYQVILSDGTKVWLNAGSTLNYPNRFTGNHRTVEVSGEAFFEVMHDEEKPFRVNTKTQQTEVLGTSFNLTAYPNENTVKTTLVSGSVKVNLTGDTPDQSSIASPQTLILKPGEEATLTAKGTLQKQKVDLESVIAWKDGYFKFDGGLTGIMGQIRRWYDVQVIYEEGFNGQLEFLGKISRNKSLKDLLESLEAAGNVHFKIEEGRVLVTK